jgi:hypothetical protein
MRAVVGAVLSTGRDALATYILDGETLTLDSMPDGDLRQAYEYWRTQKGTKTFPSRHDISPEGMKPFLSKVMLIDVCDSRLDFIYRVYGTSIVTAHGKDFTGKSVRALDPPAFAELIWRQYSEVLQIGDAVAHRVRLFAGNHYMNYHRVTMPLSTDGTTIGMLLAVSIENREFWNAAH